MNRKHIISVLIVLLVGGSLYFWLRQSRQAEAGNTDETVATVVTVQVGQLRRATLHGYVTGYGTIQPAPASGAEPAATARGAAPVAGVVKRVLVSEGMHVESGATLVELEDRAAQVAVRTAQEYNARQKKLFAENNTSQKNLQDSEGQLAAAQAQLALLHISAPLSGTVARLNVRPGEAVDLTTVIAEITDLNHLVVSVDIPSAESGRLKIGDPLEIAGDTPVTTQVAYISPAVDPSNDTVTVRAPLPAGHHLISGVTAHVKITTQEHVDCLAAPAESVVANPDGQAVIAVVKQDEAVQVPVKVGLRDGGLTEVSGAGLKAGDTVVTVGAYGLPEKTKIKVANATSSEAR